MVEPVRQNKNRVSEETDKHICKFLLSSFRGSGFRAYKQHFNLAFPESRFSIQNRIKYLKKQQADNFPRFSVLLQSYNITSAASSTVSASPESVASSFDYSDSSDDDDSYLGSSIIPPSPTPSVPKPVAVPKAASRPPPKLLSKAPPKPTKTMTSHEGMRNHQKFLNLKQPHLNFHGMLFFRDDDVEVDGSLQSILTIYKPVYDPRDVDDIKLTLDEDEPDLLHFTHSNVPTFFYKNFKDIHLLDRDFDPDPLNSELFSFTLKKHQKCAIAISKSDDQRLQRDDIRLPFSVSLEKFSVFENTDVEIQKHFRMVPIDISPTKQHKCLYVFWKMVIDGETTHLNIADTDDYERAEARMSTVFVKPKLEKK